MLVVGKGAASGKEEGKFSALLAPRQPDWVASQGCRKSQLRSKAPKLLDLGEKGVYSSYTSPEVLERRLALMACTPAVLKALTTRSIQLGHAELLSGTPPEKQDGVLTQKVPVTLPKSQLGRYARRLPDGSLVFAASGQTCEKVEPYAFVSVLRPGRRL